MNKFLILVGILLSFTVRVEAATYYASTSGSGSSCSSGSSISRCSITTAVNTKAVNPDDIVEVGSGTYDICGLTPNSGTSGHPIVIRSETNLGAVLRCTTAGSTNLVGPFEIKDKSYIRIGGSGHGFDFNGSTNLVVIDIWANAASQAGIEILYNTFQNNGNQGYTANGGTGAPCNGQCGAARQINLRRTGSTFLLTAIIFSNNTMTGNYGRGLNWNNTSGTVDSNTDTLRKSSQDPASNGYHYASQFFHGGQGGGPTTVSNNTATSYTRDAYVSSTPAYCNSGAGGFCNYAANPFRTDTSASNVSFLSNLIHDIDLAGTGITQGIFTESGNNNNIVSYNRIYRVGGGALKMGSYNTNQNTGNIFSWNSIYDCECGILAANAANYTIANNIVHIKTGNGAAALRTDRATTAGIWRNNDFYNQNTTSIGKSPAGTSGQCENGDKILSAWDTAVGGTNEKSADPLYINVTPGTEDLGLQGGSPAINAADDGSDMGYLPFGNPPPATTITMTYPNGGDDLIAGDTAAIMWTTNQTGNCKIELARDGATYAETLTASVACSAQTYSWTVTPPGRITTALFKVTSLSAPTVTDTSDAAVNIHGKYLSVLPQ